MRKVDARTAINQFVDNCGIAIVKKATNKLYVKMTSGECYAKIEDGKYVFSSDDNISGFIGGGFDSSSKKLKLSFVPSELNDFDFYIVNDDMDAEDVVRYFDRPKTVKVTTTNKAKEPVPMPTPKKPVEHNTVGVVSFGFEPTARAKAFRALLKA